MVLWTFSCQVSGKEVSSFSLRRKGYCVVNCAMMGF